jgi:preprotein translocase subunit Sss1
MATSYRANFIDTESGGGLKNDFCNKVFCSWDYAVEGEKASGAKKEAIANQFKERLEKSKESDLAAGWERYLVFFVVNVLAIGAISGIGYLTHIIMDLINEEVSY